MKRFVLGALYCLSVSRLLPHLVLLRLSPQRPLIEADLARWDKICLKSSPPRSATSLFFYFMTYYLEYRNLFYFRIGGVRRLVEFLCPPMESLMLNTGPVGPGLFIQHGIGTIITAKSIGEDCWVNQQVTIGYAAKGGAPVIGDRVTINAGAKVIGEVTVGSDVVIGANAVVVKNVPPNVTVVGVPAYIVRRDGVSVREQL
jgi:serine O-acetyltransferase